MDKRNNVGIFNSRNYINSYMRDLQRATTKSPVMFTITSYARRIAGRYEAALMLINCGLVAKGERLAHEYEKQMTLLVEFANDEAELSETETIELLKQIPDPEYPPDLKTARRAAFVADIKTQTALLAEAA
jgi:hypothetical protein